MLAGGQGTGALGQDFHRFAKVTVFLLVAALCGLFFTQARAQNYSFSNVVVEGNDRIEPATIVKFAGIARGEAITEAGLNDAVQRIVASGLFASVDVVPSGNTLIIRVVENPTINVISFEGNRRLKDEDLSTVIQSQSRRVYSPAQAEADAAAITQAYVDAGRLAARVEPRIIERDGNRVDLVFEIREGRVTEVERLSFTGNRSFSDRRLRQVLETKQAGFLRQIIQRDTFIADRIEFDKQLLTDFYRSRGFIDFQVLSVSREFSRERDAFFLTFAVREGLSYKFGNVTAVSEYEGVDATEYRNVIRIRPGATYSPLAIDTTIARMENVALRQGVDFMNVVPRITRNERNQTLDIVFALTKGPRVFVERIDIEGNATTLDRVIRRQFRTVEGDPFNPREIRQAAERIRALDFFSTADVQARQGTAPDQVIVDVNVEEQPTGSLTFGASYSVSSGVGFNIGLSESNFLGRGQFVSVNLSAGTDNQNSSITFIEPAFLDRDLRFRLTAYYNTTDNDNAFYSTRRIGFSPSIDFPLSEFGRLELRYKIAQDELFRVSASSSALLQAEAMRGAEVSSAIGYTYSYDTRIGGLDPNSAFLFNFGQDFAGLGGDIETVTTTALARYQTRAFREELTLRAEIEGGAVFARSGDTRLLDRFTGNGKIRGFEPNGLGPRDLTVPNQDAVGGNFFAVARLEAEFPLGLPEEYGITGGLFADVGSVWGLDNTLGGTIDDDLHLRSVVGVSIFWDTALGPLRFNFSKALEKQSYDKEQSFDFTVSTRF
ncbi:Outer membrane protein assembly factor BamA [Defluviimonas aquaemixtae]|uniref:Outer membrane protein assembly factor BamA n=1 Tax=Albidovulum aquaemixtae TaxID=1542388 RepID=A0A2R8B5Y7_9RHOB|nr:outer membrane protein assembly factor BamA [Defluviimonas aquaemixtae]SPH17976.1 Outer membrane protein assembly factor BamA [Defluviimonas aquaemixtae]